MRKLLSLAAIFIVVGAAAQNPGALTPEILQKISSGYKGTPADKAIRNALNTTSITVLAENADNAAMIDTHFSDEVKIKGITNQKSSGRCWLFTGLNVLRAKTIEQHDLGEFQFSQTYLFFYDQLEKANLFLQAVIDTRAKPFDDREVDWLFQHPISDGGTFTGVADLIAKYGVVPAETMPESFIANNTSALASQLRNLLRQYGLQLRDTPAKELQQAKLGMLSEIYRILCLCYGEPPASFEWTRYNSKGDLVSTCTYTPRSFYSEFVGKDLENSYIMLMNDPLREYGKIYEIEYDRHLYDGQNWVYLNLPVEKIKEIAIASIKGGDAMYFSCDVSKFLNRSKGVADLKNFDYDSLLGVKFTMDKKQRVQTHSSGSSHAMTLIAVDLKDNKPCKWMVENSWGANSGYKGRIIMTDEWFDEYMFRLVVEKKYIPSDISAMLNQTPILLPAWDPMFLPEE